MVGRWRRRSGRPRRGPHHLRPADGPGGAGRPGPDHRHRLQPPAPAGSITYGPANTIDGDRTTAWNSDSPQALGRGEELTFRFAEPVDLKALRFVNGYTKSDEIFAANHRLRDVVVHTDGASRPLTLLDTGDPQEISFDFGLTSKVRLEVVEVYPGDGFDNPELSADLAVSEVSFLAVQR